MSISRRSFIRVAGGAGVILAAGIGGFAVTREPTAALKPWRTAGKGYTDPRKRALSYAILAPNPHNRQPWLVDLSRPDVVTLHCDRTRLLPETDPFDRQILIGLGCFLELLAIAAAQDGFALDIQAFPDGVPGNRLDDRAVARVVFSKQPSVKADPLFQAVPSRRTNKDPYDISKPVSGAALAAIAEAGAPHAPVKTTNAVDRVKSLRALTWKAHKIEVETPRTLMESVRLMRIGKSEINASPDGIDIGGFFPEAMSQLGILTRKSIADPNSTAFEQGLEMYREIIHSAMAYVWIETPDNTRTSQLAAGRAWLRVNLAATAGGVSVHPVSQALQEYKEMESPFKSVHRQLGAGPGGRIQMLARAGHAATPSPSPRWPLTTRIKPA